MNYKLAKQLKDAGFPQKWKDGKGEIDCPCRNRGKGNIMTQSEMDGSCGRNFEVYKPTLEELIGACGEINKKMWEEKEDGIIFALQDEQDGWLAGNMGCEEIENPKAEGKTPEEAVAKLWLELNKSN